MIWGPKAFSVSRDVSWPAPSRPSDPESVSSFATQRFSWKACLFGFPDAPRRQRSSVSVFLKNAYIDPAGVLHDGAELRKK